MVAKCLGPLFLLAAWGHELSTNWDKSALAFKVKSSHVNPVRCWCLTLCTADCPPPPPAHRVAYLNPMNAARQEVSMEEKNQSIN